MPSTPSCYQCKQSAYIKCLHCSVDFCRLHFHQHEETIHNDIHPLIDRLNHLTEQYIQIDSQKQSYLDILDQWKQASYRRIDYYCRKKAREIEGLLNDYKRDYGERLLQIKDEMQPFIVREPRILADEQRNAFQVKLKELERLMKETMPSFEMTSLGTDLRLISLSGKNSRLSLLDLKMPKRKLELKFDASPITTDGTFILLQDTNHSLGLYNYDTLLLHHQIALSSLDISNIVDLHWSHRVEKYLVLTCEYLYTLDKTFILCNVLRKTANDFRTLTSDDDQDELFLASSKSIETYTLSTFKFSKQYSVKAKTIYSLRFNSTKSQFGLTVRTHQDFKWYFEVRNRSMVRLWSIQTPIEHGSCFASTLFNGTQWIIINIHGDILFQVTSNGKMKSEVIYAGKNLLNVIEHRKMLIIRTYEHLGQYEM